MPPPPTSGVQITVPPSLIPALVLLLRAEEYARQQQAPAWDFAEEISTLQREGLANCDLRWLVCAGYVEHAVETTGRGHARRQFRRANSFRFAERSCFVLTPAGVVFAQRCCAQPTAPGSVNVGATTGRSAAANPGSRPTWDAELRELWFGEVLVKQFRQPAPNQETILAAFSEEGWPPRVADPLPPQPSIDAKQRLHDTITNMNRNLARPLLHFSGDGTGEGIRWQATLCLAAPESPATLPLNRVAGGLDHA